MFLVFGQTGQLARELAELLPDAQFLGRDAADLADPKACAELINQTEAAAIINAAAWTDVDGAESQRGAAFRVNADAPKAMAEAAAARGIPFVHISTDYVFDGSGTTPWTPDHKTDPVNIYGESKRQGEIGVVAAAGTYAVLRTAWVFSPFGKNFVKSMLHHGAIRDEMRIVADQTGGPTPAHAIAAACVEIARDLIADPSKSGIYHFSGAPDVTWAEFAREIFAQTGNPIPVQDIETNEFPTPAKRPANSRLDCATTQSVFGITRPDWRVELKNVLARI